MSEAARRFGPAIEALHVFLHWAAPVIERFPRELKFIVGDRIQNTALDALERLIEATYDRERQKPLQAANLAIEKMRHLFRLAFALQCLDERRYEHAARQLDDIGRMIGGWKKQAANYEAKAEALPAA